MSDWLNLWLWVHHAKNYCLDEVQEAACQKNWVDSAAYKTAADTFLRAETEMTQAKGAGQ